MAYGPASNHTHHALPRGMQASQLLQNSTALKLGFAYWIHTACCINYVGAAPKTNRISSAALSNAIDNIPHNASRVSPAWLARLGHMQLSHIKQDLE